MSTGLRALACLALFVLTVAIHLPGVEGVPQRYDAASNVARAHHIANGRIPSYTREPGFAAYLSVPLRFADLGTIRASELPRSEEADDLRALLIRANIVVIGALVVATFLTGLHVGVPLPIMLGLCTLLATGNYWRIFPTHELFSEAFTALLMLCHGALMYGAFRTRGWRAVAFAFGSSISLAWLVLTKAIFLYYLYVALPMALVLLLAAKGLRRQTLLTFVALALPATAITVAYMARNHVVHDHFAITSVRDTAVMTARAGFHLATREEYIAGFAFYTPHQPAWFKHTVRSTLSIHHTLRDYYHHERRNLRGFYADWSRQYEYIEDFAERNGLDLDSQYIDGTTKYIRDPDQAGIVKRATTHLMLSDPLAVLRVTALMSWKQAFPELRDWPGGDRLAWTRPMHEHLRLAFLPAAIAICLLLLWRLRYGDWRLLLFAPAGFSFLAYASMTHVNLRYGAPIVPFYFIAVGLLVAMAFNWLARQDYGRYRATGHCARAQRKEP